ncbi:MAG: immunoglobulin domain-containing protein [Bacillaceae bacterium]|nr:immunoglobulin domain-containing protein [Bacillaceae bacterium]
MKKKIVGLTLATTLALTTFAGGAFAAEAGKNVGKGADKLFVKDAQNLEVLADTHYLAEGQTVTLTASVLKTGSSVSYAWKVGKEFLETGTELEVNEDGLYVSTITFTADQKGTYHFTFDVNMAAGKSHVNWHGEEEVSVEYFKPHPGQGHGVGNTPPGGGNGKNGK